MHMKSFKTRNFQKKSSKLGRPKIFSDPEPCRLAKNFIFWREQKIFFVFRRDIQFVQNEPRELFKSHFMVTMVGFKLYSDEFIPMDLFRWIFIANLMIQSNFRNPNFLESIGIKFETNQCQSPMNSIFNNSQMINGLAGQISSPVSFSEIPEGSPMGQHGLQSAFQSPFNPHSQHNELNPPETHQVSQYHWYCIIDTELSS